MATAKRWFAAFWKGPTELAAQTTFPFVYRDGDLCPGGQAKSAALLSKALGCLMQEDVLRDDVKLDPSPKWTLLTPKTLPAWANRWSNKAPAGAVPVSVYLTSGGSATELIIFTTDKGVPEVWRKGWLGLKK